MKQHPDIRYLIALREGDSRLIAEIYEQHASTVRTWIVRNSGTVAEAQDIFQEALIALHQKAQDTRFVLTCPLGGLLFQICRNLWLNQLRRKNREDKVRIIEAERYTPDTATISQLEQVEEENLRQRKLDTAFAQLSELCQRLLRLLADGKSASEAAQVLGMNDANTVYRRKHACVTRWRALYLAQNARL